MIYKHIHSLLLASLLSPAVALGQHPEPPTRPTSGFYEGRFFLSDGRGRYYFAPSGRLHLDTLVPLGDGVTADGRTESGAFRGADMRPTMFGARVRTEILAGWLDRYTLQLSFEFGAGTGTQATQYNSASLQNCIVNIELTRWLNLTLGMFNTPFTIENRTSSNTMDMIERSVTVRSFALAGTKEWGMMLWGEDRRRIVYGQVAFLGGDGNRTNTDSAFQIVGRTFVHPLATVGGALSGLHVGGSALYSRAGESVTYAYQTMRTVGGFAWFSPIAGSGTTLSTLVPFGDQLGLAAELMVPVNRFDLRAELVYRDNHLREVRASGMPDRGARLSGTSHYVTLGWWVFGTPRVSGSYGYQNPWRIRWEHVGPSEAPQRSLELLARWEMTRFTVRGDDATNAPARAGDYTVQQLAFAANYWVDKYVRFSLAYFHYFFPDSPSTNRAHGPRSGEGPTVASYGELMARFGLAF